MARIWRRDTAWCLVVQGQYRAFVPLYIEKVEIWLGVTDALLTHRLKDIVLLSLSKV